MYEQHVQRIMDGEFRYPIDCIHEIHLIVDRRGYEFPFFEPLSEVYTVDINVILCLLKLHIFDYEILTTLTHTLTHKQYKVTQYYTIYIMSQTQLFALKTKLKYAYYELNYEYQDREYSSVSLDILVCNYLLHQAHKELNKRIESEVREDTSLEVMLSKYPYGMELRRCQRTA